MPFKLGGVRFKNRSYGEEERAIPSFWFRRMPIARDRLKHTHAVALGVDERDISSHTGYLHRLTEDFAARLDHFLY